MKRILTMAVVLGFSASGFGQEISKQLSDCVGRENTVWLSVENGGLVCKGKGGLDVYWVTPEGWSSYSAEIAGEQLKFLNEIKSLPIFSVDYHKLSKVGLINQDDQKVNGSQVSIDAFLYLQNKAIVSHTTQGKTTYVEFKDTEPSMTRFTSKGREVDVDDASKYGLYWLAFVDPDKAQEFENGRGGWNFNFDDDNKMRNKAGEIVAVQAPLPGTMICSKPKRWKGINLLFRKWRSYVSNREPAQYCYQKLKVDLPPGFSRTNNLAVELILPYSQKSVEGYEDDAVIVWRIRYDGYLEYKNILLTSGYKEGEPRVAIGLTTHP